MKKLVALLSMLSLSAQAFTFVPKKNMGKPTIEVELDVGNTVLLQGEVNSESVSKVIRGIELSSQDVIYVYLNTPGGSVFDGMKLVSYIRATPKKIVCVVDTAISMGFVILQACDERVSTSSSLSMQHTVSYGIKPQPAPNAVSFQSFLERSTKLMDEAQASRIGISYETFKKNTRSDWWTYGQDIKAAGISDKELSITCTKKAISTEVQETVRGPFGVAKLVWSACPLITAPLEVNLAGFHGSDIQAYEFIQSLDVKSNALKDFAK
jgi:ATP-dependent protease ClpP protease subunit